VRTGHKMAAADTPGRAPSRCCYGWPPHHGFEHPPRSPHPYTPQVVCTAGHRESPVGNEFLRVCWRQIGTASATLFGMQFHAKLRLSAREAWNWREIGPIVGDLECAAPRPEQDRADFGENLPEYRFRPSVRGVLVLVARTIAVGQHGR
jgi:hypothetical protein